MDVIKLKNGTEEVEPLVRVTMMSLRSLMSVNPVAFYELVELCKDRTHVLFGNTGKVLEERSLVQNGVVHDSVRNIVLSAVTGEGLEMRLTSPVAA